MVRTNPHLHRLAAQARRRVAFWEGALIIRQVLGTVHSDLLQLIVDRVQPPILRARKKQPPCLLS